MVDKLIRDIPLIQRYARHNEGEDFAFRAFLKGRLNLSNEALDAVVQETTDEVWKQIDCLACGNCCRTLQIVVEIRQMILEILQGAALGDIVWKLVQIPQPNPTVSPVNVTNTFHSSQCRSRNVDQQP